MPKENICGNHHKVKELEDEYSHYFFMMNWCKDAKQG